jgi:hypothetical protein
MNRVLSIALAIVTLLPASLITYVSFALQQRGEPTFAALGQEIAYVIMPVTWLASILAVVSCVMAFRKPEAKKRSFWSLCEVDPNRWTEFGVS